MEKAVLSCLNRCHYADFSLMGLLQIKSKYGDPDGSLNRFIVSELASYTAKGQLGKESMYILCGEYTKEAVYDKYGLQREAVL